MLVNIRTIIGFSSSKENTGSVHGAALGPEDVAFVKQSLGFDADKQFHIPEEVYEYFSSKVSEGQQLEDAWNQQMIAYKKSYPEEEKDLRLRISGKWIEDGVQVNSLLPSKEELPKAPQPTRKSSGIVVQALVPRFKSFVAGSADLMESTFVNFKGQHEFQNVSRI